MDNNLEMKWTYCYICKLNVNTKEEIKKKTYKRKIWRCSICGTILGIKGLKSKKTNKRK